MKIFNKTCAQGDVYFERLSEDFIIPDNAIKEDSENDKIIITHSESGHHHVMDKNDVEFFKLPNSITECLLVVNHKTVLEHLREFDTHESILFETGIYKIHRQREYIPQGFQLATD